MPLLGYFWKVGAALLALLFVADVLLSKAPVMENAAVDRLTIRIQSDRKWPERVVFDTHSPVIAGAAPVISIAEAATSPDRVKPPAQAAEQLTVANALALLPRPDARSPEAVDRKRSRKAQHAAIRPKRQVTPPIVLAARQGQFPWFGFRSW